MLTAREAFRLGFLMKCAEDGLTAEEIQTRIKTAEERWSDTLKNWAGTGIKGVAALGLAPLAAGAAGGYALSRMTDIDDTDVEDVKRQELIDEYKRRTEQIHLTGALHHHRAQASPGGRRVF